VRALLRRLMAWLTPITPGARRAVVVLFILTFLLSGSALFGAVTYYHREQGSQQRQNAQQAAAQRAQSEAFQRKLCTTLGRLAALKPPPGDAAGNPSRAYLQEEHAVLAELGPDVGCSK
jgi:hypothetical protein